MQNNTHPSSYLYKGDINVVKRYSFVSLLVIIACPVILVKNEDSTLKLNYSGIVKVKHIEPYRSMPRMTLWFTPAHKKITFKLDSADNLDKTTKAVIRLIQSKIKTLFI